MINQKAKFVIFLMSKRDQGIPITYVVSILVWQKGYQQMGYTWGRFTKPKDTLKFKVSVLRIIC